jgi:hypothetical protein
MRPESVSGRECLIDRGIDMTEETTTDTNRTSNQSLICALKHADEVVGDSCDTLALRILAEEVKRLSIKMSCRTDKFGTFVPPSAVADGFETVLQVDVTSDTSDKVHRCCMEIQALMLNLPAKHDVIITVSQVSVMSLFDDEIPAGFIWVSQCAGCNVQDAPGSRHSSECPAHPGERVRPLGDCAIPHQRAGV